MAKSEWSFKSAVELSAALTAKKVSAVELTAGCHRPHRAARRQDQRDLRPGFRPRAGAAREADAALARGERKPLLGLPDHGQGILQHRRPAHDLGLAAAERFQAGGGRAVGRAGEGGGRRHPRQDQRAASGSAIGRATTTSTARPTIRSISAARRAARRAARPRRSRQATARSRSAPTSAARCACRRIPLRRLCAQADLRPLPVARPHAAADCRRSRWSAIWR